MNLVYNFIKKKYKIIILARNLYTDLSKIEFKNLKTLKFTIFNGIWQNLKEINMFLSKHEKIEKVFYILKESNFS